MIGILNVTGQSGVGKTSFATEGFARGAKKIAMISWDVKHFEAAEQIGFYRSLAYIMSETGNGIDPQIEMMEASHRAFAELPDDLDILVLDAWEIFSKSLAGYVQKHRMELKKNWFGANQFWLTLEIRGHAHTYEAALLEAFQKRAKLVVVINHLQNEFNEQNQPTGRQLPASSRSVIQKSGVRIWLIPNGDKPYPKGLVIKNTSQKVFVDGVGLRTVAVLPQKLSYEKIDTNQEYVSLWDVIRYYEQNPVGNRKLEYYEEMTENERALVEAALIEQVEATEEEKAREEQNSRKQQLLANDAVVTFVKEHIAKSPPIIYKFAKKAEIELTIEDINLLVDELKDK